MVNIYLVKIWSNVETRYGSPECRWKYKVLTLYAMLECVYVCVFVCVCVYVCLCMCLRYHACLCELEVVNMISVRLFTMFLSISS